MPILHRTQTLTALKPRFVERFRCIGASCEDTCCSGWTVHVDKKTYKAYRKESVPALERMMANMTRLEGMGDRAYGAIRTVGEQELCPALHDGICSVQAHLGESYLPEVCHEYPRTNRSLDGQVEQAITLSCPEAARLALLAEDAFDFVEAPIHVRQSAVLGVGLIGMGIYLLFEREPHEGLPGGAGLLRVAGTILLTGFYLSAIRPIGFPAATGLFLAGQMWVIGVRDPVNLVVTPILLAAAIYVTFRYGLDVPLPATRILGVLL